MCRVPCIVLVRQVAIMRAEALPLLVDMSRQGDVELAHQAMGVVANLAEILENQSVMVSNGTLQVRCLPPFVFERV
jgi:hypothetical protein